MLIRTNRRQFMAGLLGAGASMSLIPLARMLAGKAHAEVESTQKRVIFYTQREGVFRQHAPFATPDGGIDLNAYASLAPIADEVTWIGEMYNPFNRQLHGNFWPLCVAPGFGNEGGDAPGGPSIDRVLAHTLGANDPVSSVCIAPYSGNNSGVNKFSDSADGPNARFHLIRRAEEAFDTLFGAFAGDGAADFEQRLARDVSLLDFVTEDVNRVSSRLASPERQTMEQYVESLAGIESKLKGLAELSCDNLSAPDPTVDEEKGEALRAVIFEMTALAMACGITNVVRLEWKGDGGPHSWWHGEGTDELFRGWHDLHAGFIAELWERLRAIPEGAGTMADNSLIVVLPLGGVDHHGGMFQKQAMLVGGAGGAIRGGRTVSIPQSERQPDDPRVEDGGADDEIPTRCISDLFTTVAHALGVELESHGDPAHNRGIIEELLA